MQGWRQGIPATNHRNRGGGGKRFTVSWRGGSQVTSPVSGSSSPPSPSPVLASHAQSLGQAPPWMQGSSTGYRPRQARGRAGGQGLGSPSGSHLHFVWARLACRGQPQRSLGGGDDDWRTEKRLEALPVPSSLHPWQEGKPAQAFWRAIWPWVKSFQIDPAIVKSGHSGIPDTGELTPV